MKSPKSQVSLPQEGLEPGPEGGGPEAAPTPDSPWGWSGLAGPARDLAARRVRWEDVRTPGTPSFGPSPALAPLTREPSPWTLRHSEAQPVSGASATFLSSPPSVEPAVPGGLQGGPIASRGWGGAGSWLPRSMPLNLGVFICEMDL